MHQTKTEAGTHPIVVATLPPLFTNRKDRRALAAVERRIERRMMREAYRELRTLRREAGYPEWRTNPLEQG